MDTSTFTDASARFAAGDVTAPHLILVLERARPLAGGACHSLANIDRVTIGRGDARAARRVVEDQRTALKLTVPDKRMSSSHAVLDRHERGWRLRDCASTNGSRINRQRVDGAAVQDGDILELGQTFFRLRVGMRTPVDAVGDVDAAELRDLEASLGTVLPWLARDLRTVARVARSDVSVLLLGETGTGKEVLARAIHAESRRRGPFVAVNCGALPATLVESLLFGHKKGAFSGAAHDEVGFVRAAQGGTLFLDEIGDLAKPAQSVLLRVLQEREVIPVGTTREIATDVRIIAATHRPLQELVDAGDFRQDLFARLAAFTYTIPALRDRIDDVGVLASSVLRKVAGARATPLQLTAGAVYTLLEQRWSLNVRELEQRFKTGVVLASDGRIDLVPGPAAVGGHGAVTPPAPPVPSPILSAEDQALHTQLVSSLREHHGNVTRVGEAMGKARSQIQRWVRRLGIDVRQFRA